MFDLYVCFVGVCKIFLYVSQSSENVSGPFSSITEQSTVTSISPILKVTIQPPVQVPELLLSLCLLLPLLSPSLLEPKDQRFGLPTAVVSHLVGTSS